MLKVMRGIPAFKPGCGPFSDSHPFWSEFTLVPYDTPITVWRTPPGSAPGTLQAALNAAAVGDAGLGIYPASPTAGVNCVPMVLELVTLCPPYAPIRSS
jgi:hypothetical protein